MKPAVSVTQWRGSQGFLVKLNQPSVQVVIKSYIYFIAFHIMLFISCWHLYNRSFCCLSFCRKIGSSTLITQMCFHFSCNVSLRPVTHGGLGGWTLKSASAQTVSCVFIFSSGPFIGKYRGPVEPTPSLALSLFLSALYHLLHSDIFVIRLSIICACVVWYACLGV